MNDNPFADNDPWSQDRAAAVAATAGAWGGSAVPAAAPSVKPTMNGPSETELSRREADLARKEAELARREAELRNSGGVKSNKNWPILFPIIHHDIAGEIPATQQGMVRAVYFAYLGLILCMFFNWVGTIAVLIGVGGDNLSSFLWAAIYGLGGIPGALWLWYLRIYNAAIKDSALGYGLFFAFYMAHLVFVGWSAIAPPILNSWSHTGFWSATSVIGKNTGVGIMYYIGAGLWSVEFLWSFWTLKYVYSNFRGSNMNLRQMQQEAAGRAAAAAV